MNKLTAIRIKYDDGTYSDEIPISTLAEYILWDDSHNLVDILGNIDMSKGTVQAQLNEKIDNEELTDYVQEQISSDVTSWLNTHVTPVGSAVVVDTSLTVSGAAADAKKTGDELTELNERLGDVKEDFSNLDITVNGKDAEITYVENEYVVNTTGAFASFNGWSRTDYLDLTGLEVFEYSNSGIATPYNCFYDANKSPLLFTTLQNTTGSYATIPSGAKYFAYSNPTNQIQLIKWLNSPHTDGLIDDINTIDDKIPETPKIVMIPKIVKIVGTQYDVHYDNIFVNYMSKDIPFKEVFGSFYGIGMDEIVRFQNDVVGTFTGVVRYRSSITDSFNALTMPSNVLRQAFTVQVIPTTSGSGITRKVLLIGDSWTAPGIYARELRTLFESADEPMNITLLGTLGNGGAYVGAENGYHEGHGAYSAKSFCTVAEKNGYTNAFYNPTTETFDFAYYMNNCGYDGVDDVFINLGINDVAEIADYDEAINYWNIMVNSIKAYNSNIKVFIGLCGLPAQYEYGTNNNNCNRSKARRLLFHERLIEEYGDRESEGFIIVPLHLSIDSEHDFPTMQMARSSRDSTLVDYCTDYVHPTAIAYNKVADTIRAYIKYAETL